MATSQKSRRPVEQTYMASVLIQGVSVILFAIVVQIMMQDSGLTVITTLVTGLALIRVSYSPDEVIVFSTVLYGVGFLVGLVFLMFIPPAEAPDMFIPSLTYFHFKILYLLVTGGTLVHSYFVFLEVEDREGGPF